MTDTYNIVTDSPQETIELGRKIGLMLKGGEIIALTGQLGTGKTHLIKGIAKGAGAENSGSVNSPTFVIVNEYQGRLDIYHIDAYRLESIAEFEVLGFDDYCYPNSVVVIEWADKIESALGTINYIRIELEHGGESTRKIKISNCPEYLDL